MRGWRVYGCGHVALVSCHVRELCCLRATSCVAGWNVLSFGATPERRVPGAVGSRCAALVPSRFSVIQWVLGVFSECSVCS